jgi:hypothetical protein
MESVKKFLWWLSLKSFVWAYRHFLPHKEYGFIVCPDEDRWKLHTLACDISDFTFWVRHIEERDFGYWHPKEMEMGWYKATEVESGCYGIGPTPQTALENYWTGGK